MKFILPLLLLMTLTIESAYAQKSYPFPQAGLIQGAIYHDNFASNFKKLNASIKYIKDTIQCNMKYNYIESHTFGDFLTRYDNGKIYILNQCGNEDLYYDFNLVVSDTFFYGNDFGNLIVDSVSTIKLLNNQIRKYKIAFAK